MSMIRRITSKLKGWHFILFCAIVGITFHILNHQKYGDCSFRCPFDFLN